MYLIFQIFLLSPDKFWKDGRPSNMLIWVIRLISSVPKDLSAVTTCCVLKPQPYAFQSLWPYYIYTCREIHKFIRSNTFAHSSTWLVLAPSFCSLAELNHMIIDSKKTCTLYMVCLNQMVFLTFTMTWWLSDLILSRLVTWRFQTWPPHSGSYSL